MAKRLSPRHSGGGVSVIPCRMGPPLMWRGRRFPSGELGLPRQKGGDCFPWPGARGKGVI